MIGVEKQRVASLKETPPRSQTQKLYGVNITLLVYNVHAIRHFGGNRKKLIYDFSSKKRLLLPIKLPNEF